MDYYKILGVSRQATLMEIKVAYRALARKYHPDHNPGDHAAEESFKKVVEAYNVLSDPQRRRQYEMANLGRTVSTAVTTVGTGLYGVKRFFQDLLQEQTPSWRTPRSGQEIRYVIELSLEEIISGAQQIVSFLTQKDCTVCEGSGAAEGRAGLRLCLACEGKGTVRSASHWYSPLRSCTACQGRGRIIVSPCVACKGVGRTQQSRELAVEIPPGVYEGYQQRLVGQGETGYHGGPDGDLVVVIHERKHPLFQRQASIAVCEVPVSYVQLVLGITLRVPLLGGTSSELVIPPGTLPGTVFRLRGQGFPLTPHASERGDAHYRVLLEFPVDLTLEQRQKLQEWEKSLDNSCYPRRFSFEKAISSKA